jgi:hypothetical protein
MSKQQHGAADVHPGVFRRLYGDGSLLCGGGKELCC